MDHTRYLTTFYLAFVWLMFVFCCNSKPCRWSSKNQNRLFQRLSLQVRGQDVLSLPGKHFCLMVCNQGGQLSQSFGMGLLRNRLCPTYICNIFNNHNSSYSLRQSDFSTPSFNTVTYGKHSLRYLGPKLWGKLSPDIRSAKTLNIFKKQIRKYDISLLIDDGCKGCSLCSS